MRHVKKGLIFGLLAAALARAQTLPPPRPYFTEPSLSPNAAVITFVSGGAIWSVPAKGGVARLLISEPGSEHSPLFSPDGTKLAFTSNRSGAYNVFVLDLSTGVVKRLTDDDAGVELDAWSHDGKWIYFSTSSHNIIYMESIYRVSASGGTPMPVTAELYVNEHYAAPSPDGQTLAFTARGVANWQWWRKGHSHLDDSEIWLLRMNPTRHYQQLSQGGNAEELWPMWSADGHEVYYVSDRTGPANIWMLPLGGAARQVTHFTDGRVVWPNISYNGRAIVFERNFGIWKLDPRTGRAQAVPIILRGAANRPGITHETLTHHLQELALSPDGKKVAFIAHGQIFAASATKGGRAIRLTDPLLNHYEIAWSPDSRKLAYVSDRDGEPHLYLYDFTSRKETELTSQGEDYLPVFSPDGKEIVFKRDGHELCRLDLATRAVRPLASGYFALPPIDSSRSVAWSPDSKWVAYVTYGLRMFRNVRVVAAAGGPSHAASFLGNVGSYGLAWSPNGKFMLVGTGQRTKTARLARIDLIPRPPRFVETQFWDLFRTTTPRAAAPGSSSGAGAKTLHSAPATAAPVKIDFENIRRRLSFLPVGLSANEPVVSLNGKWVVFTARVAGQDNLYSYSLNELSTKQRVARQLTSSAGNKGDVQFTPDSKNVFYLSQGKIYEVALASRKVKPLAVTAELDVDFNREKFEVFNQAWRYLRDNYYNPAMNGVNWEAVRAEYEPLIEGAATPEEMNRVMSLMIGELNSSHSGIYPPRGRKRASVGRIGVEFDPAESQRTGRLRVSGVVPLGPAELAGVRVGDEILAIDGVTIGPHTNFFQLLDHKTGHLVTLQLGGVKAGEVAVKPVSTAAMKKLIYREWVERNRAYVAKLSVGKLGYVHLQAMGPGDLQHLYRELGSETQNLEGVVIDIRDNEGGFVNPYAIDVLARRGYLRMTPRGLPQVPMRIASGQRALEHPTILVVNRGTLSDGEDFTQGYRALHLGKVVGEPTAGWIIYTWGTRLIDGSVLRLPHARVTTEDGQPMEMHPRPVDIQVSRPIGQSYSGQDSQLEAAVRELLKEIGTRKP